MVMKLKEVLKQKGLDSRQAEYLEYILLDRIDDMDYSCHIIEIDNKVGVLEVANYDIDEFKFSNFNDFLSSWLEYFKDTLAYAIEQLEVENYILDLKITIMMIEFILKKEK